MPVENPLANLKDIHLPPAVSWWPPAPGWWILAVFFVLLTVLCAWWFRRRYERSRPRIEALRILKDLQVQHDKSPVELTTLRTLSQLLRRTALSFYQQEEVASLQGEEWLKFLDKNGKTTEFTKGVGKIFGENLFQQKPDFEIEALFPLVSKWVKECPHQS